MGQFWTPQEMVHGGGDFGLNMTQNPHGSHATLWAWAEKKTESSIQRTITHIEWKRLEYYQGSDTSIKYNGQAQSPGSSIMKVS